jgi:hypothetical protein
MIKLFTKKKTGNSDIERLREDFDKYKETTGKRIHELEKRLGLMTPDEIEQLKSVNSIGEFFNEWI